jgi:hypothetical protein
MTSLLVRKGQIMNLMEAIESLRQFKQTKQAKKPKPKSFRSLGASCLECNTAGAVKTSFVAVNGWTGRWKECRFCRRESDIKWTAHTNTKSQS